MNGFYSCFFVVEALDSKKSLSVGLVGIICVTSILLLVSMETVGAKELEEGFVLTNDNLEANLQNTFEGNTIESMLFPGLKRRIKRDGQKVTLAHWKPAVRPEEWKTATKNHSNEPYIKMEQTPFGDEKRPVLKNYSAGLPFPNVQAGDTLAGYKVHYNVVVGNGEAGYFNALDFWSVFTNENGFERFNRSTSQQYRMYNQWEGNTETHDHVEGDGNEIYRNLVFIKSPQNLKGIGTYSVKYYTPRQNDSWAYLRSLRRVRRTPADNWASRGRGLGDFFNDSVSPFSTMSYKYPDIKFLETRTVLIPVVANVMNPDPAVTGNSISSVKWVDYKTPPHRQYDPHLTWYTPMKVHVIKQIMPEYHQLGSRTVYINARMWNNVWSDEFDKNGRLWQRQAQTMRFYWTANKHCTPTMFGRNQGAINWKAQHASFFVIKAQYMNSPQEAEDISLNQLRKTEPPPTPSSDTIRKLCPKAFRYGVPNQYQKGQ